MSWPPPPPSTPRPWAGAPVPRVRPPHLAAQPQAWGNQRAWGPASGRPWPPPAHPPRRPTRPLAVVGYGCFGLLVGAIVLALLVAIVVAATGDTGNEPTPSPVPTPSPTVPTPSPTVPKPSQPVPTPAPASGRPHPEGSYANDGYTPGAPTTVNPAFVYPPSAAEADRLMKANPGYRASAATPVRCPYDPLLFTAADKAAFKADVERRVTCLMGVWARPMQAQGIAFTTPGVVVINGPSGGPCGNGALPDRSYYCTAANTIYVNTAGRNDLYTWMGDITLAHEFAHHVQAQAGVLSGVWWVYANHPSDQYPETNRRMELQANCLGAMAFAAQARSLGASQAEISELIRQEGMRPDSETHGTAASLKYWFATGLQTTSVAACNTFLAPADRVR